MDREWLEQQRAFIRQRKLAEDALQDAAEREAQERAEAEQRAAAIAAVEREQRLDLAAVRNMETSKYFGLNLDFTAAREMAARTYDNQKGEK